MEPVRHQMSLYIENHYLHQGQMPSTTAATLCSLYSDCVDRSAYIIPSSVRPQLCLLAALAWIGDLMQCYHVNYLPVERLSHSLFPLTGNPLGPFKQQDVTSSDPAGQSVFNMISLDHFWHVWSYFVVLSTTSLESLVKRRNSCIRESSNTHI